MSQNNNDTILLVGVGIFLFFLMTKKTAATTAAPSTGTAATAASLNATVTGVSGLLGGINKMMGLGAPVNSASMAASSSVSNPAPAGSDSPTQIMPQDGQSYNGWSYYSDGTAIDPSGNIYQ